MVHQDRYVMPLMLIRTHWLSISELDRAAELRGIKPKEIKNLMPIITIKNQEYIVLTPQLAGISKKMLGNQVSDQHDKYQEIIAAIDLLVTGI
jgi:hypothetical protein